MGDVVNRHRGSMQRLLDELCSAYGRDLLAQYADADRRHNLRSPDRQLPDHVDMCPDLEVLDYIDAVFQISASIIEQQGGADPVEEPHRLGGEVNKIFEEEGVGYRRTDGRLARSDAEITHTEAVVPALAALATGRFGAAEAEFEEAVADFGRGAYRDALTNANAAAGSLREGMEETLTLTRLGVTGALQRTLSSTNPIESMFDTVRTTNSAGSGCVNVMQEEEETAVAAFGCAGAGKRSDGQR